MSGLPFTQIVGEPTLRDLLDILKKEIFLSLNCHAVATVESFNSAEQTVSATINYSQVYYQRNDEGQYTQVLVPYSPLIECPIVNLCGGGSFLTFPVKKGDQCLILFNDRDLDNYFSEQNTPQLASARLHSFQDALAIIFTGNIVIPNYSTDHVLLTDGTTQVGFNIDTNKVTITNGTPLSEVLTNITSALTNLVSALNTAFAVNAVNGSPLDPGWSATVAPVTAAINGAVTAIGELLE